MPSNRVASGLAALPQLQRAAIALVVAAEAWRTRPTRTHHTHRKEMLLDSAS